MNRCAGVSRILCHAIRLTAALGLVLWCGSSVRAADGALTLLNPYPAAGAADIAGTAVMSKALRAMQNYANPSTTDALLQQLRRVLVAGLEADVRIERQQRGGGVAAAQSVAAVADHLLFAGSGLTAGAALEAIAGLKPLALVAKVPLVLVTFNDRRAVDPALLIQQYRRQHQPLQIGTPGERSSGHALVAQLLQQWPGELAPVAYNGGHGALRGMLARQVVVALVPLPAALPYAANRDLRIVALAAASRHAVLPTVPTFVEAGLPVTTASGWHGLFASSQLPEAAGTRWRSVLAAALRTSDAQQSWSALGYVAEFGDAARLHSVFMEQGRAGAGRGTATAARENQDSSGGFTERNIFSNVRS